MPKWIDVFSLIITLSAVVITAFSVLIAFLLGRKYGEHVTELSRIREEYSAMGEQLAAAHKKNDSTIVVARTALSTMFSLVMIEKRKAEIGRYLSVLRGKNIWAGKSVGPERKAKLEDAFSKELQRIEGDAQARQHEMYILTEGNNNRRAYLHALVETSGDRESIRVLEVLAGVDNENWNKEELIEAKIALKRRVRFREPNPIDAAKWTG